MGASPNHTSAGLVPRHRRSTGPSRPPPARRGGFGLGVVDRRARPRLSLRRPCHEPAGLLPTPAAATDYLHRPYRPSPKRLGHPRQRPASASAAPVAAWWQRSARLESLRPRNAPGPWAIRGAERGPDPARAGPGESPRSTIPPLDHVPPARRSHYTGAPRPPPAGLF